MPPSETIIIADDDTAIRTVLNQALVRVGYTVRSTSNLANLWHWMAEGQGDLLITDVVLPDGNVFDMLPRIKKQRPDLPIIVMSAQNTLMTALKAAEKGAYDYLPKPFDLNELTKLVQRALSVRETVQPPRPMPEEDEKLPMIGRSPAMQEIYRVLARLMATDLTVMISGESGTGKELIARALHEYGKRADSAFVAVNMAAIPRELIESELFGHEKGAFTGAGARNIGRFEQAEGGTLFLDEIGDMPLEAQTRLLRVLQEGEYTTVGGRTTLQANVRIVAATNRDLRQQINQGLFREDLYYRLNVVPIRLPPLRERAQDIPDLVNHFLLQAEAEGLPAKTIDHRALERLKYYRWPGNVRELENLVRRLAALYSDDVITSEIIEAELPSAETQPPEQGPDKDEKLGDAVEKHLARYFSEHGDGLPASGLYARVLREIERPLIAISLAATNGNQIKAAEMLGLNRNTLRKKIRELDIPVSRGGH